MALTTLTIDLQASIAKFEEDLRKAVASSKTATDEIKGQVGGVAEAFEAIKSGAAFGAAGVAIVEAFSKVADVIKEATQAAIEYERTQNQLAAALRATGQAAGLTQRDLEEFTRELSTNTAFTEDDIRKAELRLIRFRDISKDVYGQVLKLALDFAAASGKGADEAAGIIGKVVQTPTAGARGLAQFGFALSPEQQILVKNLEDTGQKAKAVQIVLEELTRALGGAAQGENTGLYGATRAVSKGWHEMLEAIGRTGAVQESVGTLKFLGQALKTVADQIKSISESTGRTISVPGQVKPGANVGDDLSRLTPEQQKALGLEPFQEAEAERSRNRAEEQAREEARNQRDYQRLRESVAINAALFQRRLQIERMQQGQLAQMNDFYYARGEQSAREHYDYLEQLTRDATDSEIGSIRQLLAAQDKLIAHPRTTEEQKVGLRAERAQTLVRLEQVQIESAGKLEVIGERRFDDQQKYNDELHNTLALLLEQQGYLEEAAKLRVEIANRVARARAESEGRVGAREIISETGDIAIAQGALNDIRSEGALIQTRVSREEQEAQTRLLASAGGYKEQVGVLREINAIRLASIPALERVAADELKVAESLSGPKGEAAVEQAKAFAAAIARLKVETSDAAIAMQKFQLAQSEFGRRLFEEQLLEQQVQNQRTAGMITDVQMEQRLDEVRRGALPALQQMANQMERMYQERPSDELLTQLHAVQVAVQTLAAQARSAQRIFANLFEVSFTDAFVEFVNGTKTASEAFRSFAISVIRGLEQIAAQRLAMAIFSTTPFQGLTSGLASLFGGGAAAGAGAAGAAVARGIPALAAGGITRGPSLAGEAGPEAVIPLSGGRYVPVQMTETHDHVGDVVVNVNVDSGSVSTVGGDQRANAFARAAGEAVRRVIMEEKRPGGMLAVA